MTSQEQAIPTLIPDLRNLRADEIKSGALDASIALYRERLKTEGVPLSSFQARI